MKKFVVLTLAGLFLFTGCFGKDSRPEKERFIDATKEVTCLVFGSEDILDPALETQTKEIFKNYGFDVDNEEAMLEIAKKYDEDTDVQAAVEASLQECAGDLMDAFSDMSATSEEEVEQTPPGQEPTEWPEGTESPTAETTTPADGTTTEETTETPATTPAE